MHNGNQARNLLLSLFELTIENAEGSIHVVFVYPIAAGIGVPQCSTYSGCRASRTGR
jgi:hypothetical protein